MPSILYTFCSYYLSTTQSCVECQHLEGAPSRQIKVTSAKHDNNRPQQCQSTYYICYILIGICFTANVKTFNWLNQQFHLTTKKLYQILIMCTNYRKVQVCLTFFSPSSCQHFCFSQERQLCFCNQKYRELIGFLEWRHSELFDHSKNKDLQES